MSNTNQSAGDAVRTARHHAGMTQADVAFAMRAAGHRWDRHQVSRVENGWRRVSAAAAVDLAEILAVPVGVLLEGGPGGR